MGGGAAGELRSLLLRALDAAADAHLRRGAPELAAEAEITLASEPFREAAYRRLMAVHVSAGGRGEALRAYERCRRVLAEALGVAPTAKIEAAYIDLLGEEPDAGVHGSVPACRVPLPPPPPRLSSRLVGRDVWRDEVDARAWSLVHRGQPAPPAGPARWHRTKRWTSGPRPTPWSPPTGDWPA